MKVELFTLDDNLEEVWIDAYINDHRIDGYWLSPAYLNPDLGIVVDSDEMNIMINGHVMTIKINYDLIEMLEIRLN